MPKALKAAKANADEMVVKQLDQQSPRFATVKAALRPQESIRCQIADLQGKRLTIKSDAPFAPSTAISVEYEDSLYLGEVIVCSQELDQYTLEIKVEQILSGLQSLMSLRAMLLNESPMNAPRASFATKPQYNFA